MAHTVKFEIPRRELSHANIEFIVYKNGSVFGKLLVSKGAVVWRGRSKSKRSRKLNWTDFDRVMKDCGSEVRGG
jgi:hypothetical protein